LITVRRPHRRRGFALVIVLLVGFVAAAIAASVLSSAGSTAVGTGASAEAEIARSLALAGLERAEAYVAPLEDLSGDYDMVLDPGLADAAPASDASCATTPCICTDTGSCNLPEYTESTASTTTYNGKKYRVVPMNGGAYLTRFEDNADDDITDSSVVGLWATATNNHKNDSSSGTSCTEGTSLDNPFRDRDRTIFVTVIGIAPGTDPVAAKHRVVYRETLTMQTPAVVNGIEVFNDLDAGGSSSNLFMCSAIGTVVAGHNFAGGSSARTCYCGDAHAANVGSWKNCDAANNVASGCDSATQCAAGTALPPAPATETTIYVTPTKVPTNDANAATFAFNWQTPCNFFVGKGTSTAAAGANFVLWGWDAEALRGPGGTRCGDMTGRPMPMPDPADTTTFGACWLPLVAIAADNTCSDLWGNGEVDPATSAWRPKGTGPHDATAFTPGAAPATLLPAGIAAFPYPLPDWSTCSFTYPGQTLPTQCTACDGTKTAMRMRGGVWFFEPGDFKSVVPGSYYYPGNLTLGAGTEFGAPAVAPSTGLTTLNLASFPPATIVVEDNLTIGAGPLWFGTGAKDSSMSSVSPLTPRYASLVVGNDLKIDNGGALAVVRIAGSVWVGHDFSWKEPSGTEHTFDGEIHVAHNAKFDTGTFRWNYTQNLQGSSDAELSLVTAPVRAPSSE
jgi:Tfp pilus assembly protein PilX